MLKQYVMKKYQTIFITKMEFYFGKKVVSQPELKLKKVI